MANLRDFTGKNPIFTGTDGTRIPLGNTGNRVDTQGIIRFNTSTNLMEYYDGTNWKPIDAPPVITGVTYPGSATALNPAGGETLIITGGNIATTGVVTVTIDGTSAGSVTVDSASQITITTPAKVAGDYTIIVANPSGLSGQTSVSYSAAPAWNTNVDTILATVIQNGSVNITSLSASEGADTIAYSETTTVLTGSGAGKMNLNLNAATCAITGTAPAVASTTIFTFTLRATDDENQTTDRQFKITVNPNFYGDGSDGALST
jgi:hypothetical protein